MLAQKVEIPQGTLNIVYSPQTSARIILHNNYNSYGNSTLISYDVTFTKKGHKTFQKRPVVQLHAIATVCWPRLVFRGTTELAGATASGFTGGTPMALARASARPWSMAANTATATASDTKGSDEITRGTYAGVL